MSLSKKKICRLYPLSRHPWSDDRRAADLTRQSDTRRIKQLEYKFGVTNCWEFMKRLLSLSYYIYPSENPSDKDINDELCHIFGVDGEVNEVKEGLRNSEEDVRKRIAPMDNKKRLRNSEEDVSQSFLHLHIM
nr:hypothetical protein [Tanacetum cinerariifolium]